LLDCARPISVNKYSMNLARLLWSKDELKDGIVEPQKPTKKNTLSKEKVKQIKSKLFCKMPEK